MLKFGIGNEMPAAAALACCKKQKQVHIIAGGAQVTGSRASCAGLREDSHRQHVVPTHTICQH